MTTQATEEQLKHYTHTACCFARTMTLSAIRWNRDWDERCRRDLTIYFSKAADPEAAFNTFCERAVFAGILDGLMGSADEDLWRCLFHRGGVCSNPFFDISGQKLASLKRKNPFYVVGLPIMTKAIRAYLSKPDKKIIDELSATLAEMDFAEHMDIFHEVITTSLQE